MPARLAPLVAAVLVGSTLVASVGWNRLRPERAPDEAGRLAAYHFLDRYMGPDGRVSRWDQGGDTVSEGQAYAMLAAQAVGDRGRFHLAWEWARAHLQGHDGLLAWRWADGRVQDAMPAADADLDAAWALVLASARFDDERLRKEGLGMAAAVLEHETVSVGEDLVLVAGPWARGRPAVVNPSYVSPGAMATLARETGDARWRTLATTSQRLLAELLGPAHPLPPDWSHLTASGTLEPASGPGLDGQGPRYGLDAPRLLPRLAACGGPWRDAASSTWPVLAGAADSGSSMASDLHGRPLEATPHPVKALAAAAAARAAGDKGAGEELLSRAELLDGESPTYYGAAWLALGRLLLTSSLGAGCSP